MKRYILSTFVLFGLLAPFFLAAQPHELPHYPEEHLRLKEAKKAGNAPHSRVHRESLLLRKAREIAEGRIEAFELPQESATEILPRAQIQTQTQRESQIQPQAQARPQTQTQAQEETQTQEQELKFPKRLPRAGAQIAAPQAQTQETTQAQAQPQTQAQAQPQTQTQEDTQTEAQEQKFPERLPRAGAQIAAPQEQEETQPKTQEDTQTEAQEQRFPKSLPRAGAQIAAPQAQKQEEMQVQAQPAQVLPQVRPQAQKQTQAPVRLLAMQPREFQIMLKKNQNRIYLIDVQERHEFSARHIRKAINLPLSQLSVSLAEKYSGRPVLLYSRSGFRARQAYQHYFSKTKTKVIYLLDGGLNAWHRDNEPKLQWIQGFQTTQAEY